MWWGIGREDECTSISQWRDLLKEVSSLPNLAPCGLGKIKSLRSSTNKKNELIRLWNIIFKSSKYSSKSMSDFTYKPELLNLLRNFSADYPEINNVYGFSESLKAIESSARRSKKAQRNDPIMKQQIYTATKTVAGRSKLIICRAKLDKRKKAEAWVVARQENKKRFENKFRKFTREEVLLRNITKVEETEFQSILKSLFEALLDQRLKLDNKQELINAIRIIYQAEKIPTGVPPWYPELLEEPYYPNADLTKCAHFLFVLGSLEQGNFSGRWEEESLQYLLKNQTQEGYWSSSTFKLRPDNDTTVAAMHALALWKPKGWDTAIQKGADWLWKQQRPDGSWTFYTGDSSIILDAIDLADGKFKHSLKLSNNAIEFVDIYEDGEPENPQDISDNIETHNIRRTGFKTEDNPDISMETIDFSSFETASKYPSSLDKLSIQGSFTFRTGQILFGGRDLGIKTGITQGILEKLVVNFGYIVTFKELAPGNSSDCEAGEVLRGAISYLRKKLKQFPVKIENRRGSGYLLLLKH